MPASRKASSKDVNRSRCFPTPLVKKIRLGTMSLPNAVASGTKINEMENAQFNTMVCKGNMNFTRGEKKMAGNRWRGVPPQCPDSLGEGPGQNRLTVPQRWPRSAKKQQLFALANTMEFYSV